MTVVSFKLLRNCLSFVVLLVTSWQLRPSLHVAAEESPIEYSCMNSYIVCDLDLRNDISWKLVKVSGIEYWLHFYELWWWFHDLEKNVLSCQCCLFVMPPS
jgi:hypothetical protein